MDRATDTRVAADLAEQKRQMKQQYSKRLVSDIRALLWVVTVGGLALSALCILLGYLGSLPWLTAMVGLPWSAHAVVCAAYLGVAKSDHRKGGITYDAAEANGFARELTQAAPAIVSDSDTAAPTI